MNKLQAVCPPKRECTEKLIIIKKNYYFFIVQAVSATIDGGYHLVVSYRLYPYCNREVNQKIWSFEPDNAKDNNNKQQKEDPTDTDENFASGEV
jgi:hypothetical protein